MNANEFDVDETRATTLFRVLQESLTNVIRHADASRVVIELYREDSRLVMKISDNGRGIDPDRRKPGHSFGLIGVQERINALNGEFMIDSGPGKGTALTIFIPLETVDAAPGGDSNRLMQRSPSHRIGYIQIFMSDALQLVVGVKRYSRHS